jgi:hypothetical protein
MSAQQAGCSEAVKRQFAEFYRDVAITMFGKGSRDKMLLAEMSVTGSIGDIVHAENNAKKELAVIAERVRGDGVRNRSLMKELLLRSRTLRSNMALMAKKRIGMEQHLETLRQSQLNQTMLLSMKHTSDALQTMGMKLSDADNIVLDLEDTTNDINSLQTALSSNFASGDFSDDDLHAELELLLADDLSAHDLLRKPEKKEQSQSKKGDPAAEAVAPEAVAPEAVELEVTVPEGEQVMENPAASVAENTAANEDQKSPEADQTSDPCK